jgi:hypothetical protein
MGGAGPIFILSSARSGSTLFRFLLDTHPEIYSPPELNLGRLAHDLATSIAWLEGTHDLPLGENRAAVERTRAMLGEVLDSYARRRGKPIWCEKSPDNARFGELLAEVFPDARFLCLYRHVLDVTYSWIDTYRYRFPLTFQEYLLKSSGDNVQAVFEYWADNATWMIDLERRLPARTFRLRYEDLVAGPEGALAPLFVFLGLAWDPAILTAVFSAKHDHGPGDPYVHFTDRIRRDSVGKGRNLPIENLPSGLRDRVRALLAELGYPERLSEQPAQAAVDAGQATGFEARLLFEQLPARAAAVPPPPAPFACEFVVHGPGGGAWALEWDANGLRVTPGSGTLTSRIELAMPDLAAIASGRANPLKIAQEGRIHTEGLRRDEALPLLLQLILAPS